MRWRLIRARGSLLAAALIAPIAACEGESSLRKVPATGFFDPPAINFGVRNVGLSYDLPTVLRNTSAESIQVQEVRFQPATDAYLLRRASDDGTLRGTRLAIGEAVDVVVRFRPQVEGDNGAVMTVVFADFEIDVPISATAERVAPARPEVRPGRVDFAATPVGARAVQVVEVVNAGQTDGALRAVQTRPPFSVQAVGGGPVELPGAPLAPSEATRVEVVFAPVAEQTDTQEVLFELDTGQRTALTVSGVGVPGGRLTCTPADFDLGDVPRGQVVTQPVDCQASGGPYRLAEARFTPGSSRSFGFAVRPTDVDTQGRTRFEVRFVSDSLPRSHRAVVELVGATGARTPVTALARTVPPDLNSTAISLRLDWNTGRTDFDLHLVRAPGALFSADDDCFFEQKNPDWGDPNSRLDDPFLDRDDRDGFGPEIINLATPAEDRFDVYVQYFGHDGVVAPSTSARVTVTLEGGEPTVVERNFDACGGMWHVGQLDVTADGIELFRVDTVSDDFRAFANPECQ